MSIASEEIVSLNSRSELVQRVNVSKMNDLEDVSIFSVSLTLERRPYQEIIKQLRTECGLG